MKRGRHIPIINAALKFLGTHLRYHDFMLNHFAFGDKTAAKRVINFTYNPFD